MPTTLTVYFCTVADCQAILSQNGVELRLDDDNSGAVTAKELNYLAIQGRSWATDQIRLYTSQRYLDSDLADSWLVNSWAAWLMALFVAQRRCNPVPESLSDYVYGTDKARGVYSMLQDVYDYRYSFPGITEQDIV